MVNNNYLLFSKILIHNNEAYDQKYENFVDNISNFYFDNVSAENPIDCPMLKLIWELLNVRILILYFSFLKSNFINYIYLIIFFK